MKNTFPPKAPSPPCPGRASSGGFGVGRASCAGCVNGHHSPTLISTRKKCPGDFRVRPSVANHVADGYAGVVGGLWAELLGRQGQAFKGSAAWYSAKSPALGVG